MPRFQRIGKIFDPRDFAWDLDFIGFAQSPQALIFPSFVRVYFATRVRDGAAAYISHVRYVDFTKDFATVLGWSQHEVLGTGALGCFDEHGVFPINVLRVGDAVYGYTNGWTRRVSVPVDTAVGLVISRDEGRTFQRYGRGPVLAATLHEPFLVGDAFVRHEAGRFDMWYIHGLRWLADAGLGAPERVYKIAHAESNDGISWRKTRGGLIEDRLGPDECQALPTVLYTRDRYHMIFCYRAAVDFRQNPSQAYRLGYAWSTDGRHWSRTDELEGLAPAAGDWDADMMCYPHLCDIDGRIFLLYNGNAFGRDGFGIAEML
jgi:hypothetical protein